MSGLPGYIETPLSDPFEVYLGPVWETGAKGARRFALRIDERHVNMRGVLHGGMLMTFADLALGQAVWDATDHANVVTLNVQSQFLKTARAGDVVEVTPKLMRRSRSLLFIRGDFEAAGEVIYTASSIWKILGED